MPEDYGMLTVRAYTAGGGLPVENVKVIIRGAEDSNSEVYFELMTDEDGNTPTVNLPAPKKNYSLAPSPTALPYALYDMEIEKEGYYSKKIYGLTVFSGINSLQLVNMIPLSEGGTSDFPRGSLNTVIPENTHL